MFWTSPGGAAAISGAANLAGGLLGGGGSAYKDRLHAWDMANDQYVKNFEMMGWQQEQNERVAKEFAKNSTGWQFDDLMESADKSGIHRLAALGGASSYSGPQGSASSVSQGATPGPAEDHWLGDAVGEALRAYQSSERFKHQKEMDKADLDIKKRTADLLETESQLNAATSRTRIKEQRDAATNNPEPPPDPNLVKKKSPNEWDPDSNIFKWIYEGDTLERIYDIVERNVKKAGPLVAQKQIDSWLRKGVIDRGTHEYLTKKLLGKD